MTAGARRGNIKSVRQKGDGEGRSTNGLVADCDRGIGVVKGLCGFANTLVFDTIMGFTADPALITPVEVVINTPSNCIMVWRERQYIQWKKCLPVTALIILGSIPGMLMLKSFNAQWLKAVFGVIVALLAWKCCCVICTIRR